MQSPSFEQTDYRGREDDGSESAATWIAGTNTDWNEWYQDAFRLRLAVRENNGAMENNVELQLQYNYNSGGWTNVTTSSSVVQATTSSNFADGDATTQQITTNTFIGGEMAEDGVAGDVSASIDYSGGETTECEWMLDFVDADVSHGDTVQFRAVMSDGTLLNTYTNTPTVTVETQSLAVTTGSATSISDTGATLNGDVTFNGFSSVDVWFDWRQVGNSTWNSTTRQTLSSGGSFSDSISSLSTDTEYEFRAQTESGDGTMTDTGSTVSFWTKPSAPAAPTDLSGSFA